MTAARWLARNWRLQVTKWDAVAACWCTMCPQMHFDAHKPQMHRIRLSPRCNSWVAFFTFDHIHSPWLVACLSSNYKLWSKFRPVDTFCGRCSYTGNDTNLILKKEAISEALITVRFIKKSPSCLSLECLWRQRWISGQRRSVVLRSRNCSGWLKVRFPNPLFDFQVNLTWHWRAETEQQCSVIGIHNLSIFLLNGHEDTPHLCDHEDGGEWGQVWYSRGPQQTLCMNEDGSMEENEAREGRGIHEKELLGLTV